jgi:hypothetical protein
VTAAILDDFAHTHPVLAPRRPYYVYIVASVSRTIYVGVTNDRSNRL